MAGVQARTVLWYYVFAGFAINYMIRINVNIAIVDMVLQPKSLDSKTVSNECIANGSILTEFPKSLKELSFNTSGFSDSFLNNLTEVDVKESKTGLDWNEYQQGLILGAFFWMHWATQIPGGVLAKKYGTKLIFGLANVIACWICFLVPILSNWDYKALIVIRIIQGFVSGVSWPAMHSMTGQWIPPNERSKFVTAYMGCSVGIALFYPLFGYVILWLSWEWIFYLCGIFGTLWYVLWVMFVFDSPSQHPRITTAERNYIEDSLAGTVEHTPVGGTPWASILASKVVWLNILTMFGSLWGLFTVMTQAPTYFRIIHGWSIKMTGILSGLPHLMRVIFAFFFSIFGDYLLESEKMTLSNVRKMAAFVCCCVNGFLILGLAYSGCNSIAAIVLVTAATAVHGAITTGPLASMVDISPNYASIVFGVSNTISVVPGFISPAIVGYLTFGNQTITSWKYVFFIASGLLIICGLSYVFFCETKIQPWNTPGKKNNENEMEQLNEVNRNTSYFFEKDEGSRPN